MSRVVTGLRYVTDVAHDGNAALRFDYGQVGNLKLCNDPFASSLPLQVTTALVQDLLNTILLA